MRKGWEIIKVGEIASFQRGLTYSKNDEVDFSSNIVLRSNNVDLSTNQLDLTELRYINDKIKIAHEKKVVKGSLLICTANGSKSHLGKIALIDKDYPYAFGGFMGQLTPHKELDSKYFFYALTSGEYKKFICELSDGVNINNLKFDDLKEFSFPLPTLREQKHLVTFLDKAFVAIDQAKANVQKNMQNTREIFESYLYNVFANPDEDWEESLLGDVCEFQNGQAHEKQIDENGKVILVNSKFVSTKGVSFKRTKSALSPLFKGDIVMVMSDVPNGKTLAKCHIIDKDNTYSLNQRVCVIRSKMFYNQFLFYQLNRHKYLLGFDNGENQTNLRKDDILNCPLFVAPMKSQEKIVSGLNEITAKTKKLQSLYEHQLNNLDELKKSILQKAFAGELA